MDPYDIISLLQSLIFEQLVLPLLHRAGFSAWADEVYDVVATSLLGLAFIVISYIALRPLESLRPVEQWRDRKPVRVDVLYTFLEKLGILPLLAFLLLEPLSRQLQTWLHWHGWLPTHLEHWLPILQSQPVLAFVVYLLILDFSEYWRHRLQHRFNWWWGLHSIHHSQRYMSFWCDSRNHVVDGVLQAIWLGAIAQLIGIPGGQFLIIILVTQLIEALSHVNARLPFGRIGEKLLVGPYYHRLHHGMGVGHQGAARGCNFATLFPVWDILFRTARFDSELKPTGILDQLQGADYGEGFWAQQRQGLLRMFGRV